MFATQGQQLPWEVCAHRNPQDPQRCSKNQGLGQKSVTTFLLQDFLYLFVPDMPVDSGDFQRGLEWNPRGHSGGHCGQIAVYR